jgi:hypothetical protein
VRLHRIEGDQARLKPFFVTPTIILGARALRFIMDALLTESMYQFHAVEPAGCVHFFAVFPAASIARHAMR